MKIRYAHIGPERESSIELPPKAPWIGDYVLAYDESLERTVYMVAPDFHQMGLAYAYDGETFEPVCTTGMHTEDPKQRWQGFYDPSRGGVAAWNFCWESDEPEVFGVLLKDGAVARIETTGEGPQRSEEADETGAVFAFDPARNVTLCLTQLGLWELSADGAWTAKRDGEGLPTEDWKAECHGGTWDPVRERCFFWAVAEDENEDDRFWLWSWDGANLELHANEGMPEELVTGWMNVGPLLCGHPQQGLVAYCGHDGFIAYDGTAWSPWDKDDVFAPKSTQAKIGYDPRLDTFVLGPGDYEPAPGEFPEEQHLFFVRRSDGWQKLGVTVSKSALSELWSKRFGAFSAGKWRAMGNFYLTLLEWDDESGWNELLDKRAQQKLWDGGHADNGAVCLIGLVDCDGVTHTVSNEGHVFRWAGSKWEQLHGEANAMKRRMWASLTWDPQAKRIVVWGGRVKGRKNNDLLFFEDGAWRVSRKKSPKPVGYSRKKNETEIQHQLYWDTTLGCVVRVGWDELALLRDDAWQPCTPEGMAEHNAEEWRGLAHDPKTGTTLVLDLRTGAIAKLTPEGCSPVGSFELPELVRPDHVDEAYAYRCLTDDWAFDAATGLFHAQNPDDQWGHYVLDLKPFFQA